MNRCVITLSVFLLFLSCVKHQSRVAPDRPGHQEGEVSFRLLVEPGSEKKEDPEGWEFQPPRFSGEPGVPVYPERALAARFGSATIVVRIVIGVDGGVTEVSQRPGSTPGPFAEDFRQAVEAGASSITFRAEAPGILRWAIDGCLRYQRTGLAEPEGVAERQQRACESSMNHIGIYGANTPFSFPKSSIAKCFWLKRSPSKTFRDS